MVKIEYSVSYPCGLFMTFKFSGISLVYNMDADIQECPMHGKDCRGTKR